MLVADKVSNDNSVTNALPCSQLKLIKFKQKFESLICAGLRRKHKFPHSLNIFKSGLADEINSVKADIVNLHWINGCMLSIKEITQIKAPIVWTLHDAWAFCGAEHHHLHDDNRYKEGYDSIRDLNRYVWRQKRKYWDNLNFNIVTPSTWLGKEAAESCIMRNKNIQVIHNGIDLNVFKPPPEKKSSKDKKLIAFGAFDVNDWNKGGGELLEALRILRDKYKREFELLLIGNGRFDDEFKVKNTGFISSDADIAPIYPQADVFVLASKYDNLPNMLVEASACGVPLVGFDTGGIPDIIKTGKNGYLAKAFNCEDLAHGLDFVLNDKNSIELSKNARESAEKNFDIKNIARQYIELYEEIING
jgi:glycosyltransferase involved in cell wall biosynthesis